MAEEIQLLMSTNLLILWNTIPRGFDLNLSGVCLWKAISFSAVEWYESFNVSVDWLIFLFLLSDRLKGLGQVKPGLAAAGWDCKKDNKTYSFISFLNCIAYDQQMERDLPNYMQKRADKLLCKGFPFR